MTFVGVHPRKRTCFRNAPRTANRDALSQNQRVLIVVGELDPEFGWRAAALNGAFPINGVNRDIQRVFTVVERLAK